MKNVLVVDDEEAIRFSLSKGIAFLGYQCTLAATGREAWLFAQRQRFDLILLDVKMPDMGGLEALKKIRQEDGLNQGTPVIMVTAYSQFEVVEESIKLGANDFLVKPFQLMTILERVSHWVNTGVQDSWTALKPEQENLLRMTVRTMDSMFRAVREGNELPFEQVKGAATQLIKVMDNGNIAGVLDAVREHDDYTFTHSLRVGIYMTLFAQSLASFSTEDLLIITSGGVAHDVGKAKIPLTILNKPSALDPDEMKLMMQHVDHSAEILARTPGIPHPVIDISLMHHERMDGSGYPLGLKGDEIDIFGRMAAIVDVYVALTDTRVYKPSIEPEASFKMMENEPGGLDKSLLADFKEAIFSYNYNVR